MKKKVISVLLCMTVISGLVAGCGSNTSDDGSAPSGEKQKVELTMWGQENDQEMLQDMIDKFVDTYSDYADISVELGVQSDSGARDRILTDQEAAADVFSFPSDRLQDLVSAGALQSIEDMDEVLQQYADKTVDDVKEANVEGAVEAATFDDTLYAFPMTADNGYFLYYNKNVISEEQVKSWSTLLDAAQAAGQKVGMTLASGWYNASFFYSAGFTTSQNEDGTTNIDWNGTADYSGVEVTQAMLDIASHPAFMAVPEGDLANQIASGTCCAGVSGTWDSVAAQEAFGDGFAATKLPSFKIAGDEIPHVAVAGYKLIGVNAHSENAGWAALLADFITNEEQQRTRFEVRSVGPSNKNVLADPMIEEDITASAVVEQSEYAVAQNVGNNFWAPTQTFGEMVAKGQLSADDTAGIQAALDTLVEGVEAPVE